MTTDAVSARTKAAMLLLMIVTTSSPNIAKPNVICWPNKFPTKAKLLTLCSAVFVFCAAEHLSNVY